MIVRQPDYLKTVDGALIEVPLQTWKDYLTFGTIAAYADYLPAAFVEAQFQFNGTVIDLRAENQPRWKRGVETTEGALGDAVGRLYVERYFKGDAKACIDALIRNLLAAFKAGIDDLEWMSPATKVQAQATLAKYSLKIAYPDRWRQVGRCASCLRLPGLSRMSRHCANRTKPLARRPLRMKSGVHRLHLTMCSSMCGWRRTWHSTTNSSRKP